jgi:hypothetical protein
MNRNLTSEMGNFIQIPGATHRVIIICFDQLNRCDSSTLAVKSTNSNRLISLADN